MRRLHCLPHRLDSLCERHLASTLDDVEIVWGSMAVPLSGCHGWFNLDDDGEAQIVISPLLMDAKVPIYVLDHVIWHEACHAVLYERGGEVGADHGPEFCVLEVLFPGHAKAMRWLARHEGTMLEECLRGVV